MFKLILSFCVIFGFWCIGQSLYIRLRLRPVRLRRFLDGLNIIEGELRFLRTPLPQAFAKAAGADPVFAAASAYAESENAEAAPSLGMTLGAPGTEEQEILQSFVHGLASVDVEGQLQNIALCRTRLLSLCDKLDADIARLGRLYTGGTAMAGALLVILLI